MLAVVLGRRDATEAPLDVKHARAIAISALPLNAAVTERSRGHAHPQGEPEPWELRAAVGRFYVDDLRTIVSAG
jgi:hypothetical protein